MFRMAQQYWKRSVLAVCGAILAAPLVYAQSQPGSSATGSNTHTEAERSALKYQSTTPTQLFLTCLLQRPGQVQRFRVTCTGTHKVDVKTADCCLEGDHWQMKVKAWDTRPNTAVTTSPGGIGHFGVVARVYNYNATQPLDTLVECSYLHGVNVFPAETSIIVEHTGGACTATDLGFSDEIDRTP
jgi:hypothetical protein